MSKNSAKDFKNDHEKDLKTLNLPFPLLLSLPTNQRTGFSVLHESTSVCRTLPRSNLLSRQSELSNQVVLTRILVALHYTKVDGTFKKMNI